MHRRIVASSTEWSAVLGFSMMTENTGREPSVRSGNVPIGSGSHARPSA